jgi:hypothetical protein
MEWLVLILAAAGVAASVTLLWGFSGCDVVFGLTRETRTPENLAAMPISTTEISVSWKPDFGYDKVEVERSAEGEAPILLPKVATANLTDTGLIPETTYFYRARAIGPDKTSGWSGYVSATTLPIPPLDLQPSFEAALPLGDGANPGRCLVQRIEGVRLLRSGAYLQLTISGSTNADLIIDRIHVSRASATGKPYDADFDLTHVATGIVIPAADPPTLMALPPIAYVLDADQPLLIAFDINSGNQGLCRHADPVAGTDATAFSGNRHQAAEMTRTPGYTTLPRIYLVQKIEVA